MITEPDTHPGPRIRRPGPETQRSKDQRPIRSPKPTPPTAGPRGPMLGTINPRKAVSRIGIRAEPLAETRSDEHAALFLTRHRGIPVGATGGTRWSLQGIPIGAPDDPGRSPRGIPIGAPGNTSRPHPCRQQATRARSAWKAEQYGITDHRREPPRGADTPQPKAGTLHMCTPGRPQRAWALVGRQCGLVRNSVDRRGNRAQHRSDAEPRLSELLRSDQGGSVERAPLVGGAGRHRNRVGL
jgi:hypothetical protein